MKSLLRFCILLLIAAGVFLPYAVSYADKLHLSGLLSPYIKKDQTDKTAEGNNISQKLATAQEKNNDKLDIKTAHMIPDKGVLELPSGNKPVVKTQPEKHSISPNALAQKAGKAPPLKAMIGQMLMLGFKGTTPRDGGVKSARALLAAGDIGGLIFMGENLTSKAQVKELVTYFKSATLSKSSPFLPFLGIDQEGGYVQRLKSKHGFSDIPTAETVALSKKIEEANATYTVLASELADVGFNMNFGPVVDLNLVPTNPVIGAKARSYGADPVKVQLYAKAFVEAHKKQNMLTAIKHFPGHGSSWTDSHEQFVDLSSSWQSQELAPYRGLMKAGLVDMVMVGHLYHPAFSDNDKRPASLSRTAITKRLRGELGFKGLVITDDLGMGAVKKYFEFSEALILAVNAGNDILLIAAGHYASEKDVAMIQKTLLDAVASGRIKKARIRRSYERIIAAKKKLAAVETY